MSAKLLGCAENPKFVSAVHEITVYKLKCKNYTAYFSKVEKTIGPILNFIRTMCKSFPKGSLLLLPGNAIPSRKYKNKTDPCQFHTKTVVFN